MANYNKVMLLGNLTRDPQLRYTPSQMAVCEFGLAVNRRRRSSSGEQQEEVCFVDITAWAKQAETISKYLTKGRQVFVDRFLRELTHRFVLADDQLLRDFRQHTHFDSPCIRRCSARFHF